MLFVTTAVSASTASCGNSWTYRPPRNRRETPLVWNLFPPVYHHQHRRGPVVELHCGATISHWSQLLQL